MDEKKVEAFMERIFGEVNSALSCLNLYLGHRLDLFQSIKDAGPITSRELAQRTGYNERYLREWLECMAVADYLDYEIDTRHFSLTPEHAVVLLDRDNHAYAAAFLCFIPGITNILTPLIEAFRSGGGVPFEAYGADMIEGIEMGNRPMFINDYVALWIPAMPDIQTRLQVGGRVAEIGCGAGWASISLAKGFPNVQIDAIDPDVASVERARQNAEQAGVADRITFHLASAEEAQLNGDYDLVTAFEVIHDAAYPVKMLSRMRELAASDGTVLIADEAVGETLDENRNFLGQFMYNASVLHCLPQSMVYPGTAETGTIMSASKLEAFAREAGFQQVDVLPVENMIWRFYRLTP
jgi:2-polyprenyl-3-methyl-5-hydroxy-6-metoxy-1,4-benzoquinol methylase